MCFYLFSACIHVYIMCIYDICPIAIRNGEGDYVSPFMIPIAPCSVALYRFSAEVYWYGPILNFRNVALAIGPVLPSAFSQICLLQSVL